MALKYISAFQMTSKYIILKIAVSDSKKGVGTFPHRDKIIYGLCIAAFIVRATVLPLCKWVISPGPDEAYLTSNYVLTVYLTPPWHSPCTWEDHGGNPTGSNVKEWSKLPLKKKIYIYVFTKTTLRKWVLKILIMFFILFAFFILFST